MVSVFLTLELLAVDPARLEIELDRPQSADELRTRCPLADRLKIRTSVLQMVIIITSGYRGDTYGLTGLISLSTCVVKNKPYGIGSSNGLIRMAQGQRSGNDAACRGIFLRYVQQGP